MPVFSNYSSFLQYEEYSDKTSKKAAKKVMSPDNSSSKHVVYSEVLIHCISVSLQEHQKKITVYNKKIMKKSERKNCYDNAGINLPSPHLQYMNIYSKQTTRLGCFKNIPIIPGEPDLDEGQQDASTYENYLSDYCKKAVASKPVYIGAFDNVSV